MQLDYMVLDELVHCLMGSLNIFLLVFYGDSFFRQKLLCF
jgi:hypothetical protein